MNEFLEHLVGSVFKILPLKEDTDSGIDVGLKDYIDSVVIQLVGGCMTYPELNDNQQYISVVNTVNYMNKNDFTHKQCRREVFKCIKILQELITE